MPARGRNILGLVLLLLVSPPLLAADCVIMLHGLGRTARSLANIEEALVEDGYMVANIDYPSRADTIENLAVPAVNAGLAECRSAGADRIDFVTHSMGGILLRYYLASHTIDRLHRVVMLAPPNQGSKVVDTIRNVPGYVFIIGPAGLQLGTDENSIPLQLGPVQMDLGIITGTTSFNPVFSPMLDNPDDGAVSVESARVEGMCGFLTLPVSHSLMMLNGEVVRQVLEYLKTGLFSVEGAQNRLCDGP